MIWKDFGVSSIFYYFSNQTKTTNNYLPELMVFSILLY